MAGKRPNFKIELTNLKQMKVRFADMAKAIDQTKGTQFQRAALGITQAFQSAAVLIRDKARSNAAAGGTPRRLYSGSRPAIFAFSDFQHGTDDKRKRSALVGVRTGLNYRSPDSHLYVQWFPKGNRRSKDNSKLSHGGLSMSLARIFESGTHRGIKPRRYFRNAIFQTRGKVLSMLTNAYKSAVDQFQK